METRIIAVWMDDTNEADAPWCVCEEAYDEDRQSDAAWTETISMHETQQEAVDAARVVAKSRALPIRLSVPNPRGGYKVSAIE